MYIGVPVCVICVCVCVFCACYVSFVRKCVDVCI